MKMLERVSSVGGKRNQTDFLIYFYNSQPLVLLKTPLQMMLKGFLCKVKQYRYIAFVVSHQTIGFHYP